MGAVVERAERDEAEFWAAHARNVATSDQTRDTGAVAVAGGYALCLQGTFLTYGLAVGSARALRGDDLRIVDEFYAARGLPARLELHPAIAERDAALLRENGFSLEASVTVLERDIASGDAAVHPGMVVDVVSGRRSEWIEIVVDGFLDATPAADHARLRQATFACAGAASGLFVARIDGRPVGGGALGVAGEAALLYSASVLPAMRGRGVHAALIAARLAAASERGATYAMLKSTPGSRSHSSAVRAGFRAVYDRQRLRKA